MDCSGVKEHLVDFLYEELPSEARVAFTEHVRGCSACRAEVASYRQTLGNTRAALSGPLATEPPARVHDAVMRAATAAAAKMAERAPGPREARNSDRSEPGFFTKLLRTPWLFPAFGAVSVATVVFLVRVLKNPEVIPGQRPTSIEEQAVPAEAPASAPAREIPAEAKPAAEAELPRQPAPTEKMGKGAAKAPRAAAEKKAVRGDPLAGLDFGDRVRADVASEGTTAQPLHGPDKRPRSRDEASPRAGSGAGVASRFATPPPPREAPSGDAKAGELKAKAKQDLASEAKDDSPPKRHTKASRDMDDLLGDFARPKSQPLPAKKMAEPERMAETAKTPTIAPSAPPPSPAPSPVAAAAPPIPTSHAAANQAAESERRARPAAPPPSPALTAGPRPSTQARRAPAASADKAVEAAPEADHEADAKTAKGQAGPSLEESIRKADRLFASQDWNAAAEAYRDLLRRFPSHKESPRWRARVDQALVAERDTRDSTKALNKAKKATGEALDGLKQ